MEKEKCFYLGVITKTLGYKGEVVIFIDADSPEHYHGMEMVLVEIHDKLVPYFIEKADARNKNNQLTLKFQDINTHDQARQLQGCELYLPLELLPPLSGNAFYFHEIKGYTVIDKHKGEIGHILQVVEYPGNPLFEIENQGRQILVPVKDEIIEKLDRENRIIHINAPEGLIDLYI